MAGVPRTQIIAAKRVADETYRKNTVYYLRDPLSGIKLSADPVTDLSGEVERRFLPSIFGLQRRLVAGKEGFQVRRSEHLHFEKRATNGWREVGS
jgi:hypothetical protein